MWCGDQGMAKFLKDTEEKLEKAGGPSPIRGRRPNQSEPPATFPGSGRGEGLCAGE